MYTSPDEFKNELMNYIQIAIHPLNRSDQHHTVRCPYCGDSRKNASSTHFGIRIVLGEYDVPLLYKCFLCHSSGIVTHTTLKDLQINDLNLLSGIRAYNKNLRISGGSGVHKNSSGLTKRLLINVPLPNTTESNIEKLAYINKRLGTSLTLSDCTKFKIVLSLGDLVRNNLTTMKYLTCSDEKASELDKYYLGFVTVNNDIINMRKINDKSRYKRYEKYKIKQYTSGISFYVIPTKIDLLQPETITIEMAEGFFDIASVYFNLHEGGKENSIYVSANGSSYNAIMKYFREEGFIGNVNINIYRDSEVPVFRERKYNCKSIQAQLEQDDIGQWFNQIKVMTNTKADDFGHTKENIKVKEVTLQKGKYA